jgi:hypothetical protein
MTGFRLTICGVAVFCFASGVSSQESDSREDLLRQFSELISESTTDLQEFETNGFKIQSSQNKELGADFQPNGNEMQILNIEANGMFNVAVEKGRPMSTGGGIALFHRESGVPMLGAGDQNGDGSIDILTYGVIDENGKHILDVIDYEADGQADLRLNFSEGYFEIWHNERWHRAENRDGERGIVVDGSFREIHNIDNRPVVQ